MRIGHYAPHIWAQGGVATYIRRVGRAQEANGHGVFYLSQTPEPEGASLAPITVADDRALFEKARALRLDILHLHKAVGLLPPDRVPTVRTMHDNHGSCPSGSRYLARPGVPCHRDYSVTGCLWGHLVDHCGSRRPQKTWANFKNIHHEQHLAAELPTLAVSRFVKDRMIRSGCPAENLHVLRSPAPEADDAFAPLPREGIPRFVFLGRITPEKGVDWLLRAAARSQADLRVDIAGDGSERVLGKLRRLTAELDIEGRVAFHGWLEDEAVDALIRQARAVVVPSMWQEPAGLVTLEAAALGRPVIASRIGGIPEYAREAYALLVPPGDTEGLAARLTQLADDPARAERLGRRGRAAARERFSMSRFLRALHGHYRRASETSQSKEPTAENRQAAGHEQVHP